MKKGLATIWAVIITVVIMIGLGVGGWFYLDGQQKAQKKDYDQQIADLQDKINVLKDTSSKADSDSADTSSSSATTNNSNTQSDPYLYTNSTYGFSLQFNSKWQGYKMMPANNTGSTATYYVCVPTTDSNYAKASSTSLAGTVSIFAVSVYTKAQWAAATAEEGPQPTKMGDAGTWVVAYSTAQDYPQETNIVAAVGDYKNVIATFKEL